MRPKPVIRLALAVALLTSQAAFGVPVQASENERVYPVRVFDAESGTLVATLSGHTGRVVAVTFSPDGRFLASAAEHAHEVDEARTAAHGFARQYAPDHGVRLWDLAARREIARIPAVEARRQGPEPQQAIAFSADGKRLATGTQRGIRWWDVPSAKPLETWPVPGAELAVDPTGRLVAASRSWPLDRIRLLDAASGTTVHDLTVPPAFAAAHVAALVFDPSGTTLVSTLYGNHQQSVYFDGVYAWSTATGKVLGRIDETFAHGHATALLPALRVATPTQIARLPAGTREQPWDQSDAIAVAADPAGHWLAAVAPRQPVRLQDLRSGATRRVLDGHDVTAASVAVSPDGRFVAVGAAYPAMSPWSRTHLLAVKRLGDGIRGLRFSADGKEVAIQGDHGFVRWNPVTDATRIPVKPNRYQRLGPVSPDGRYVALYGRGAIVLTDLTSGGPGQLLAGDQQALFSPDSHFVATGSFAGKVRVYELQTRRLVGEIALAGYAKPLAWHQSARWLAIGSEADGKAQLTAWDGTTGRQVWQAPTSGWPNAVRWDDGDGMFGVEANALTWRAAATGELRQRVALDAAIGEARVDAAGRVVALSRYQRSGVRSTEPNLRLFDLTSRQITHRLGSYQPPVDFGFSPNGRWFYTTDSDADVVLYDAGTGHQIARLDVADTGASVAFSPDSSRVVTGGDEGMVRLWRLDTGD